MDENDKTMVKWNIKNKIEGLKGSIDFFTQDIIGYIDRIQPKNHIVTENICIFLEEFLDGDVSDNVKSFVRNLLNMINNGEFT